MSGQNHKKAQPSDSFSSGVAGLIAVAVAFALIQGGGWSALQKYVSHRISHEKLAAAVDSPAIGSQQQKVDGHTSAMTCDVWRVGESIDNALTGRMVYSYPGRKLASYR
jgi:hypothetical protein